VDNCAVAACPWRSRADHGCDAYGDEMLRLHPLPSTQGFAVPTSVFRCVNYRMTFRARNNLEETGSGRTGRLNQTQESKLRRLGHW